MEGKWKLEADPSLSSCNERHLQQFGNRTSQCYLLNFGMVTLHFAWYLLHLAMFAFHFAWYLSRFSMSTSHLHGICMVFAWLPKSAQGFHLALAATLSTDESRPPLGRKGKQVASPGSGRIC